MKLLITFIILNIVNVILQTVKSIATLKCGKTVAALVNAVAFGLYTIVVVYINCELALWVKALVVALCNLIGVYIVKYFEEKARKDKVWRIEITIPTILTSTLQAAFWKENIKYSIMPLADEKNTIIIVYAYTQQESEITHKILDRHRITKYFISETKSF